MGRIQRIRERQLAASRTRLSVLVQASLLGSISVAALVGFAPAATARSSGGTWTGGAPVVFADDGSLWEVDASGQHRRLVDRPPPGYRDENASLADRAKLIMFQRVGSPDRTYLIDWPGRHIREVPNVEGTELGQGDSFSLSADGQLVAFDSRSPSIGGIFIRSATGGRTTTLRRSSHADTFGSPEFSEDGRQLVFIELKNIGGQNWRQSLEIMNTNGTGLRSIYSLLASGPVAPLGPPTPRIQTPSFSPNGHQIVFTLFPEDARTATVSDHIVSVDGSKDHVITSTTSSRRQLTARFSPDGRHISFQQSGTDPEGRGPIVIANADGSHRHTVVQFARLLDW